jgi:cyclopropane fatty-acyl-phospholipid synthase-like methyltransferase
MEVKQHWENVYSKYKNEELGWFENDLSKTFKLIEQCELSKNDRILNVGSGTTLLIDELINKGFNNLIATDISETANNILSERINDFNKLTTITDDLTNPTILKEIRNVDLWIDRAVLHFFTEDKDQSTYFDLLKSTVNSNGYVILAMFAIGGAEKCSALPIKQYSKEILTEKLGNDFKLIDSFEFTYVNPGGHERPYIYTLFQKN